MNIEDMLLLLVFYAVKIIFCITFIICMLV